MATRVEQGHKRVRAYVGGALVADTTKPLLVWEKPWYPTYYFPAVDVAEDMLVATGEARQYPDRGQADLYTIKAPAKTAENAAYRHTESSIEQIRGHYAFVWPAIDAWFEEDEQVYVHARDPYTRVDVLQSSRHVRVEIDGVTVADSHAPRILFETNLPPRYYLPPTDVRLDMLRESHSHTKCPYKGVASYHSVEVDGAVHKDIVWYYPYPAQESAAIAGYLAFYNEKVDIYLDGELMERPKTVFS